MGYPAQWYPGVYEELMTESDKKNAGNDSNNSQDDESPRRGLLLGNAKPIPIFVVAITAVGWLLCVSMLAVLAWERVAGS